MPGSVTSGGDLGHRLPGRLRTVRFSAEIFQFLDSRSLWIFALSRYGTPLLDFIRECVEFVVFQDSPEVVQYR